MSAIHVHRVATHVVAEKPHGEVRWCFRCRARVAFVMTTHVPDDLWSYYGPHYVIACVPNAHADGDLFPGSYREWSE